MHEVRRRELMALALKPEGTEARKKMRQNMTHTITKQCVPSGDYSNKAWQTTKGHPNGIVK